MVEPKEVTGFPECAIHQQMPMEIFCLKCSSFICQSCADDTHFEHAFLFQKSLLSLANSGKKVKLAEDTIKLLQDEKEKINSKLDAELAFLKQIIDSDIESLKVKKKLSDLQQQLIEKTLESKKNLAFTQDKTLNELRENFDKTQNFIKDFSENTKNSFDANFIQLFGINFKLSGFKYDFPIENLTNSGFKLVASLLGGSQGKDFENYLSILSKQAKKTSSLCLGVRAKNSKIFEICGFGNCLKILETIMPDKVKEDNIIWMNKACSHNVPGMSCSNCFGFVDNDKNVAGPCQNDFQQKVNNGILIGLKECGNSQFYSRNHSTKQSSYNDPNFAYDFYIN